MVYKVGVQSNNINVMSPLSFRAKASEKKAVNHGKDALLLDETSKRPITTNLKIQADKFVNACTKYPIKGFMGSKNANFYEFLTMGSVPYLVGSGMMMAVFNLASKFFDTPAAVNSSKLGKKMALGVAGYGIAKSLSKKLIELPVKWKHGIDVNMPYKKVVYELPEERNKDNLVTHEYHKVFESVDFPRWDLLYDNKHFGPNRNSYYDEVGKRMGIMDGNIEHSDQKVKPEIKEKVIKTRVFSTVASYLWAATSVGVAMQKPWENLKMTKRIIPDFAKTFVSSCKEFLNHPQKTVKIAGRMLFGVAAGVTLLGNLMTLFDFNKDEGDKAHASASLIDDSKEKVVC